MIVLQILKIIGIVLACIVGFVLLVALLVFFVPVNYSLSVKVKNSDTDVKAAVGWLARLISFKIGYGEKKLTYSLRAAGIKIMSSGAKEKPPKESRGKNKPRGEAKEYAKPDPIDELVACEEEEAAFEEKMKASMEAPGDEQAPEPEDAAEKIPFPERLWNKIEECSDRIKSACEKLRRIYEKAKSVKYVACAPVTKRALSFALGKVGKILKSFRPRSIKGNITIGTEDPSQSAFIYGTLATVSAQISKKLYIHPELENKKTDIDVLVRGRITIGYVVLMALQIITNKDVKRVIRYVRRNF